jgi:hypothetical protein
VAGAHNPKRAWDKPTACNIYQGPKRKPLPRTAAMTVDTTSAKLKRTFISAMTVIVFPNVLTTA